MGKVINLKPKEKFEIIRRKKSKIIPFLTKEESKKIEKKKKEIEFIRYILKNSPRF